MPVDVREILQFWGKAQPREGAPDPSWHPAAYHLLDVAAAADAILEARPLTLRRGARLLGLAPEDARRLLVALAALHDLGKFAPAFQAKSPAHWPVASLGAYADAFAVRRAHTEDGFVLWDDRLGERTCERLWLGGRDVLDLLAPGVFGHHGRPVGRRLGGEILRQRFRAGGASSLDAALACADAVLALLMPEPIVAAAIDGRQARTASWWVAGLMTVADWVGSNQTWFPYRAPAADDPTFRDYWSYARDRAAIAVREAGLVACSPSALKPFVELTRVPGDATPVQAWAERYEPLPAGPVLVVIEDVTGSGKTEAAQMLVHRLMAAGRASGAYWAMPTMATANAMYARQGKSIDALYAAGANGERPSLVLAHGQQRLHDAFRDTVLYAASDDVARVALDADDETESSVACAAFLADDRRAALLADVGAGTVDQALLGALPSKFNTVRLFGLADKVLVIDEAHAYDAYMRVEVHELLRFHAALGGSAVVLSATLSRKQRNGLARAWADGMVIGERRSSTATRTADIAVTSSAYPLATVVSTGPAVHEAPLEAAPWSHRRLPVRLVHDVGDALKHVLDARARGAAVAWVRNTVDDCLAAAALLREHGVEPLVFHARFAQGDRQAREQEVMTRFGKDASDEQRRGRVLVATQVIEQSLDLDFDAMVSDVAPVDLLVQRAGRLWRHQWRTDQGRRPADVREEFVVLSPKPSDDPPADWLDGPFTGTRHVYTDAGVLWRTVRALARVGCIDTPCGLRELVEQAYDRDDPPPTSLLKSAERAQTEQSVHAATATYTVLKTADGYDASAAEWMNDLRAPTRLGELRTTVRLARVGSNGGLDPWVQVDGPPWKSWALSELSVSAYRIPEGSAAEMRFASAVARVRTTWGRFEQEIPVLPLEPTASDVWCGVLLSPDGKTRRVTYSHETGLMFPGVDAVIAK